MIKKILLTIGLLILFTTPTFAQNIENPVSGAFADLSTAITTVSSWVRPAAVLVYLGMVIYAGYIRQTAGTDPEKQKKSMQILTYSTTGFILIIIAPLVINTIAAILGVDLLTN